MEYNKVKKFNSDIFVLKFPKDKYRIDLSYGEWDRLEKPSKIFGEPMLDEVVAGRTNCGFFQSDSEHIGGAWDGDVGYRNFVSTNDFTDVAYTYDDKLVFDDIRTQEQATAFDTMSQWNCSISYPLVKDGQLYYPVPNSMKDIFTSLQPRTMAGQDKDGAFYFVVVDGRRTDSLGITGKQSAELMLELGCENAFNCDGGGSSVIIKHDTILNKPSDGVERAVGTILLAYEKYEVSELPTIKNGSKGVYVHLLQRLLGHIRSDYSLGGDAIFGNMVETWVKAFQSEAGLTADGIVGQKTWTKLVNVALHGEEIKPPVQEEPTLPPVVESNFLVFDDKSKFQEWLSAQNVERQITRIQQHNTAVPAYKDWDTDKNEQRWLKGFKEWSVGSMGWRDSAQHFMVFPNGNIGIGRSLELNPAGITGANTDAICIEHFGYFDVDTMTEEQKDASLFLNACLCVKFNIVPNTDTLIYHHWFDLNTGERKNGEGITKTCPGTGFFGGNKVADAEKYFIPLVKKRIAELTGTEYVEDKPILDVDKLYAKKLITATTLYVRKVPQGDVLGTYQQNDVVEVYGEIDGWYQVIFDNEVGYIFGDYTQDISEQENEYETKYNQLKMDYDVLQLEYETLQIQYNEFKESNNVAQPTEDVKNKFVAFLEAILSLFKK